MSAVPRWTETLFENSTTYQLRVTAPTVPNRRKVRVVASVIWPVASPSLGLLLFALRPKTRNALVVSIAEVKVTLAVAEPAAMVAAPDCLDLRVAAHAGRVAKTAASTRRAKRGRLRDTPLYHARRAPAQNCITCSRLARAAAFQPSV